jgi:HSP20 family protein
MGAYPSSSMDLDPADLAEDVRRLFDDLSKRHPERRHIVTGECMPVVDVFETEKNVEIVLDVPGVAADCIRVLFKAGVVIIAGEKERPDYTKRGAASFHLVERDFGRFVRAVRLNVAIDAAKARARLANGELRVVLPRLKERRGSGLLVPIDSGAPPAGE